MNNVSLAITAIVTSPSLEKISFSRDLPAQAHEIREIDANIVIR